MALALIVVGLRVWGLHPGFALPLGSSARQSSTPAKATAQSSARASATRTASATPSASPTPSASALPSPQLDSEGFAHSGAVGNGSWTIAPAVPVSRPAAATVYRYVLRVEGGTHVDAAAAAPIVERILNDERGWPTAQNTSFQPVADPASADFTFNIATPPSADALCSPLDTGGMWSCRNGDNVVINSDRWNWGAVTYPDVDSYRTYVTNHEVGHFLGHEHEFCAGAGLKAPLMAQQSHDLAGGCVYKRQTQVGPPPHHWPVTGVSQPALQAVGSVGFRAQAGDAAEEADGRCASPSARSVSPSEPSTLSTTTFCPSRTSPASSMRARRSPISRWTRRRSGRAP